MKRKISDIYTTTHTDKLYFPQQKITKGDLLEYYNHVAHLLIPECVHRPLTMQRFPEGILGPGFFQKNTPSSFPAFIKRCKIRNRSAQASNIYTNYVLCNNATTLHYLVNQGTITLHRWLSRQGHLEKPTFLLFDLDPYQDEHTDLKKMMHYARSAALELKQLLESCGLKTYVMTTGSRGLHVLVPLKPIHTFSTVHTFSKKVAHIIATRHQATMTTENRKEKRGKRLLIDTMRNCFGATAVVPWCVRALPEAPIATPLSWENLSDPDLTARTYTMRTIYNYIPLAQNIWKELHTHRYSLLQAQNAIDAIIAADKKSN